MDNMKFFRVLWRLNAVLIFVLSIVVVIALIFGLSELLRKTTSGYQRGSVYLDDGSEYESDRKETWSFGKLKSINRAGSFFIVPLEFEQSFSMSYSIKKQTEAVRNYLFINTNKILAV